MANIRTQVAAMLPPNMAAEQVDAIVHHIVNIWWPQLCLSSRTPLIANQGLFDEAWYDDNHLLDIHNPAYSIIVKALSKFYAHVQVHFPEQDAKSFRARWSISRDQGKIYVRLEGPKDDEGHMKCFRLGAPACGWLDLQAEIDALRTKRDAKCSYYSRKGTFVIGGRIPSHLFNVPGSGIPSDHGALALSSEKKKAIAEEMAEAMIDNPVSGPLFHSALSTTPEEEQTTDKVSKWIDDAGTTTEHHGITTVDGASSTHGAIPNTTSNLQNKPATDSNDDDLSTTSTEKRFKSYQLVDLLPEEKEALEDWVNVGDSSSSELGDHLPGKKDEWDDWVNIDSDSDSDDEQDIVPGYKYKKEDATPAARKGWMTGLIWKV